MHTTLKVSEIVKREPFLSLFPINPVVLRGIIENITEFDFDDGKPIHVWREFPTVYTLVDGHTRLEAAIACGMETIPVSVYEFDDEDAAIDYAIASQRNRRNLTDAEQIRHVAFLDQRRGQGTRTDITQPCVKLPPSSHSTAELLGISPRKVEQIRTVLDHAPEPLKEAVKLGETTINAAYNETQERRKEEKSKAEEMGVMEELKMTPPKPAPKLSLPVLPQLAERGMFLPSAEDVDTLRAASTTQFNNQKGNDSIEWARWSWNPVTGCLHGCAYCYARDIATRFYDQGFVPTFIPERLGAPRNTRAPRLPDSASEVDKLGWKNVFVCSMADLWGKWVPSEVIRYVLREATEQAQWNYLYLTKFPQRYEEFAGEFPKNTWVGTTVDSQHAVQRAEKAFRKLIAAGHEGVRWLSIEPVPQDGSLLEFSSLEMFDWVVIGGASRSTETPEWQMTPEQFISLYTQAREAGCRVYLKDNAGVSGSMRVREYPTPGTKRAPVEEEDSDVKLSRLWDPFIVNGTSCGTTSRKGKVPA
jgi:protein gp37